MLMLLKAGGIDRRREEAETEAEKEDAALSAKRAFRSASAETLHRKAAGMKDLSKLLTSPRSRSPLTKKRRKSSQTRTR